MRVYYKSKTVIGLVMLVISYLGYEFNIRFDPGLHFIEVAWNVIGFTLLVLGLRMADRQIGLHE